jgi:uncharacterized protein YybS (DUF2232 family)
VVQSPASWGATLALVGYLLLAPPVLFFGPLAGLLLLSRPGSRREWLWLLAAVCWTTIWLNQSGTLAAQFARAAAVLLTGTFLALTLWRPSGRFSRVLAATALAGIALTVWMGHLGVEWSEIRRAVEHDLWSYNRELMTRLGDAASSSGAQALLDEMSGTIHTIGLLFPALLTVAGVAGLRLAWSWHHRIARRPLGAPLPAFSAFEFNDQLVWGWIVGLALCLLPLPKLWTTIGVNLLMVCAILYAVRGLAVFAAGSKRVPGAVIATLTIIAMFLLPFVVGGLTLLGLADTWLDFRRRLAASTT